MRLKPSCSFCKDHSKFIENTQLRILLQCYKRLCDFVNSSDIPNKWGNLNATAGGNPMAGAANNSVISGPTSFFELIEEGCSLGDKYSFSEPPLRGYNRTVTGVTSGLSLASAASSSSSSVTAVKIKTEPKPSASRVINISNGDSNSSSDMSGAIAISHTNGNSNSSMRKLSSESYPGTPIVSAANRLTASELTNSLSSLVNGTSVVSVTSGTSSASATPVITKIKPKRRGCRCGLATPNPGKLTCCGQRCPCYVDGKGCFECKCRGCRNPHKGKLVDLVGIILTIVALALLANTSPGSSVQPATKVINTSAANKQTPVLAQAASLLSPSLLLSTSISPTLNLGSSLLTAAPSPNPISRSNCSINATINFISSSSSSPTAAICVTGNSTVETLTLPFPKLDDVDENDENDEHSVVGPSSTHIGIGTEDSDSSLDLPDDSQSDHLILPIVRQIDMH